jgi:hypothetical protein
MMGTASRNAPQTTTEPAMLGIIRSRIMAGLATCLNFLLLNLALVIASLPLITLPVAINAAWVALERWRVDGEDRVVREFLLALRSRPRLRTTWTLGVPIAATLVGVEEVHYFLLDSARNLLANVCLGCGLSAMLITATGIGYLLALAARYPLLQPTEIWRVAAQLAIRNLFRTGPLFIAEILAAVVLVLDDPALLLVGAPIALLNLMRATARLGVRKVTGAGSL